MPKYFDIDRTKHLIDLLSPSRLTRVVDIGANPLDESPYYKLRDAGLCEVWGFEPQPDAYARLVETAGPREHYLPYAVGQGGEQTLNVYRSSGFTSFYSPNQDWLATIGSWHRKLRLVERLDLVSHRLDDIDDLPEFDLLKIDVQGAETQIFEEGGEHLRKACAIITEVAAIPIYEHQPLLSAQMDVLGGYGYSLHKFLTFTPRPLRGCELSKRLRPRFHANQLTDGDAVFIRKLMKLEELDSEKVKHLAILADSVFESFDITTLSLSVLVDRREITMQAANGYVDRLHKTT
ncbi:FkbM family methyltransferase [Ruegeria sp. A3M17]|uniref:FkbM family methyltransferase n=1 Tax=Ruegeria sp. A3M17 TaxID=2267229 RepID=UPI000DE9A13C|nr:FkbM family methyltransferase [Ruegeria sp. A3M17]RBW55938.1 FkbM family methyltransferase [Ruegeria sp. A3M17]